MLKLAKHPCKSKVKEGGKFLTCNDRWRVVEGRGKKRIIKCYIHEHVSKGKVREVYQ